MLKTLQMKECSVFGLCSGTKMCSVLRGCSGFFCGKLVEKYVGKIVGKWWKSFRQTVEKKVLHIKMADFVSFPPSSGKLFQWFYTAYYPCNLRVLHIFHRVYYNYYYYIRIVFGILAMKLEIVKNRADS